MKLGEYELDNIYNEDCYEAIKKIPDKSIDLIITDPPYQFVQGGNGHSEIASRKAKSKEEIYSLDTNNTKKFLYQGGGCFVTKKRDYHSELGITEISPQRKEYLEYVKLHGKDKESERLIIIANGVDNRENTKLISAGFKNEILDEFVRVLKNINIYIWCNKNQLRQIIDYFDNIGCNIDLLTWHKTNPIPTCNNTYLSDTEYCVYAREKGVPLLGSYETKRKYYVSECNKSDKDLFDHPTIKPIEIIKNLVINSSNADDIVLDTFMGSGTTAVACKELGRHYIGFELNKQYWELSLDRLNGITKEDREKRENGQMSLF